MLQNNGCNESRKPSCFRVDGFTLNWSGRGKGPDATAAVLHGCQHCHVRMTNKHAGIVLLATVASNLCRRNTTRTVYTPVSSISTSMSSLSDAGWELSAPPFLEAFPFFACPADLAFPAPFWRPASAVATSGPSGLLRSALKTLAKLAPCQTDVTA